MIFNRFILVEAINEAKRTNNSSIYKELLFVWYKLIEQESINGKFLNTFNHYGKISENAISFYSETSKLKRAV